MKKGKQTYVFENVRPKIVGRYSIVGPKEGEGSLPEYFDKVLDDDLIGQKTFEIAESKMLHKTIEGAVERAGLKMEDVDLLMSGDLLNQTFASNFAARELDVPFAGLYGACSSFGEGLALASLLIDGGAMEKSPSRRPVIFRAQKGNTVFLWNSATNARRPRSGRLRARAVRCSRHRAKAQA